MAECLSPYSKRDELTGELMDFPCGQCYPCKRRRISGWSFRLVKEGERSVLPPLFITLTYKTDYVPLTINGYMSLHKRDLQKFWKRVRQDMRRSVYGPLPRLRYFQCGEYGTKRMRPHYHAIVFNCDPYFIEKHWRFGAIHYGTVTEASIGYTLKYMMKECKIPMHKNDDRVPEFQSMSKGIGENYLSLAIKSWHLEDVYNRMCITINGGKVIAMPRYYKLRLYSDEQRRKIGTFIAGKLDVEKMELTPIQEINRFEYYFKKIKRERIQVSEL